MKKGDKWAAFYSELAANEAQGGEQRVGIGLSRLCEITLAAINEIENNEDLRKCLKEAVYDKAKEEADTLKPHLQKLNAGKDYLRAPKEDSFGNLKKRKKTPLTAAPEGADDIKNSTKVLFDWLKQGTGSNLRMVIAILSAGGVFYGAHAADKTARAWLQHAEPKVTLETAQAAMKARHDKKPIVSTAASSTEKPTGSLFD